MNLAVRDLRRQLPRFLATAVGLGLLYAVVLAMGGIYRGMVDDATQLIVDANADLWLVQAETDGPFADRSVVPDDLLQRAQAEPGVASARGFLALAGNFPALGRVTVVGVDSTALDENTPPLVRGGPLRGRRQLVVDAATRRAVGDRLVLGGETFLVVGVTAGRVSSAGDAVVYAPLEDVRLLAAYLPAAARRGGPPRVRAPLAAVLVTVAPGAEVGAIQARLRRWPDVRPLLRQEEEQILLVGVIDKARRQIALFRGLLAAVASILVALVVFLMTVGKSKEIALLKLLGAQTRVVVGLVVQQALLLVTVGYAVTVVVSLVAFPRFPRRVVVGLDDYVALFLLVVVLGVGASGFALRRALAIPATSVLSG